MAPRSVWKGTVGFGLVSIPVKLYGASENKDISLNQLHVECGSRISMPRFCRTCNKELSQPEIVKGYALDKETYVKVTPDDLARVRLASLKSIQIDTFCPLSEVASDPRRLGDGGYFLAPEAVGAKAFALFTAAMNEAGVAGIAKLAIREKERLVALFPVNDILFVQTLNWADELRDPTDIIPKPQTFSDKEMEMAGMLISKMTKDIDWEVYRDEYRDRLIEVIQAKMEGREIEALPEPVAEPDFMKALEATLAGAK